MVEPKRVRGGIELPLVEDRAWRGSGRVPGVEEGAEPPDYHARMVSRRASMRAHPSALGKSQPGDPRLA